MPFNLSSIRARRSLGGAAAALVLSAITLGAGSLTSAQASPAHAHAASAPLTVRSYDARSPQPAPGPAAEQAAPAPQPLTPAQLRAAYALPTHGATHQTIAVVSAFNDPTVQSDLARYDSHFHLPACTVANGCLRMLNEQGKSSPLPGPDSSGGTWLTESALGTEVAHALCESCRIVLAEADFADSTDFSRTAQAAAAAGAGVVVTTYTPSEDPSEANYETFYANPHAAFVAASGDGGYSGGLNVPAALPDVIAVGGTNLSLKDGHYGAETAWSGTVSGCSIYLPAPSWQAGIQPASGCAGNRAGVDVSAMSSPGTIIYASNVNGTSGGAFYQAQGTSVSAPIIGAVIGLAASAGNTEASMLYARAQHDPAGLHDITTGSDAAGCTQTICRAGRGWDGPTGLGTPAGLEDFLPGGPVISARDARVSVTAPRNELRVNRRWAVSLDLINDNPFRVSGAITLRRTLRIGGRLRTVTFAQRQVGRSSLQRGAVTLTISSSQRALLRREGQLGVWAFLGVRGASGRAVLVKRLFTAIAP